MVRIALLALSLCLDSLTSLALAAETLTANTLRLSPHESPAPATIEDMAWYAGTWRGAGLSGDNEEIWSMPKHGAMMGMYRLLKADGPVFYELLTIVEERNSLTLRLKHFHADLRGWEERDDSVQMPFVAKRDGRFYFEGLTFEPRADGRVTIYLAVHPKTGPIKEQVFSYQRQ